MEKLTELEKKAIKAIKESDYRDDDDLSCPVWLPMPDECGLVNNKSLSGVVGSLVKKGIITSEGRGNDITVCFTENYLTNPHQ